MNRFLRISVITILASALIGSTFACNTMEGAGKDTKAAGQAIQNSADANK